MPLSLARPGRLSTAALVVLASVSVASAGDDAATVVGGEDRRVVVQHRESRFAPVWPQWKEASTTLVSRKDKHKLVRVQSPKGGRVWTASDLADNDVPTAALRAYQNAAHRLSTSDPGCGLPWTLLAAIGRVESDHGRYAGSVLSTDGVARPSIIGVALNGAGPVAAIRDSDGGELDGDTTWDRAVGPMQFIPTTWAWAGRDGDGNGLENPHDMDDAALAAGDYLCAGTSVASAAGMRSAIFRYNPSADYVRLVRAFERGYSTGVFEIPSPALTSDKADKAKGKRKVGKKDEKDRKKKDAEKDRDDRDEKGGRGGKKGGQGGGASSPDPLPSPKPKPKPSSPGPSPQQPGPQQPQPGQQDPAPGNPGPTPGDPSPSPSSPDPSPSTPDPTPTQPSPREVDGVLTQCGADWCLGVVVLDFGNNVPASLNLFGDATSGTLTEELTGLVETTVTMTVLGDGPLLVVRFGGVTFR